MYYQKVFFWGVALREITDGDNILIIIGHLLTINR